MRRLIVVKSFRDTAFDLRREVDEVFEVSNERAEEMLRKQSEVGQLYVKEIEEEKVSEKPKKKKK